ncbi:MAG: carbohydrate ABC transporter permease [Hyphomicrobiales bacterium]|nr:carbohydrate ABC transporter permease [Hyphomicrobiales bacterium]
MSEKNATTEGSGFAGATRNIVLERLVDVALIIFGLLMLLPLVLLVANGFKTPEEILQWPPTILPTNPTLDNAKVVLAETPLLRWIANTLMFAVTSTIAILITSVTAGYILAKFPFRSMHVIFAVILATAIVPFEVYMIPLYFQVQELGLLNSVAGLLIGYLVMSFGIFLIRQNVLSSIPDELLDAGRVDGASEGLIFVRIVVPLLRGPMGALAVLAFFQAWTAFTWPLIVNSKRQFYTVEVGLALFQTGFTVDIGKLSAAAAIVLIPSVTIFTLLRRNFVRGIATGGVKE